MENQTKPKPPSSAATPAAPTTPTTVNGENLLGTMNSELSSICLSLLAAFVLARLLAVVSAVATALAAPLTGFYLMSTCPTVESFDAKRELKRVLRGDNLPEDHPDKPKGFLGKALAKVTATIEAEAAAFAGCSVEIIDIIGLVKIAVIRNTAAKTDYYWLGAVNRWRYIMARNVPNDTHQRMKRD